MAERTIAPSRGALSPALVLAGLLLVAGNLRAAITIYCSIGGLELVTVEENADQQVAEAMLAGATGEGPWLQLVAPLGPDSPVAKFLAEHRPGLHHLAYAVDDLAAEATRLAGSGVQLLYDEPRPGTSGTRAPRTSARSSPTSACSRTRSGASRRRCGTG